MRVVLHIGRHKTGTSSLQKFLSDRQDLLSSQGFLYPKSGRAGIAHHQLAESLSRRFERMDPEGSREKSKEIITKIAAELKPNHHSIILSSEAFQNANPLAVKAALADWPTEVVVYLREQYLYLLSAYQQRVHAQKFEKSLSEFVKDFDPDYKKFLSSWTVAFGQEVVRPRLFERGRLKNGNIIPDFLQAAGVGFLVSEHDFSKDMNPSIGGVLLEVKRLINSRFGEDRIPRRLYQELAVMATKNPLFAIRPALAEEDVEAYRARYVDGNEWVRSRYFQDQENLFLMQKTSPARSSPLDVLAGVEKVVADLLERVKLWPRKTELDFHFQACLQEILSGAPLEGGQNSIQAAIQLIGENRYYENAVG